MKKWAYYNECDPFAAEWLRQLIRHDLIAPGEVDERPIQKIVDEDLGRFCQVHLFGGIGGWSYALRLAGWPDDRPVWTGSCPCQPFSCAGKHKGKKDARHLWPWMRHLMFRWRPVIATGEQVASKDGREWLSGVRANLETLGYVVGASDLCSAGVASPHIRQRLFWVADTQCPESRMRKPGIKTSAGIGRRGPSNRESGGLADATAGGFGIDGSAPRQSGHTDELCATGRMGDALKPGLEGHAGHVENRHQPRWDDSGSQRHAPASGGLGDFWSRFDVLPFEDGKIRRVESGTFPLADGVPGRVGLLRGYGNAIVPQIAATFIRAYMEVRGAA